MNAMVDLIRWSDGTLSMNEWFFAIILSLIVIYVAGSAAS